MPVPTPGAAALAAAIMTSRAAIPDPLLIGPGPLLDAAAIHQ
ncbi:MAG: hypothetical protein QOE98_2649 [Gaiellaceae bacterium]|jgi:hypothetical protein|nr:hypothetical protein [Gaiellaceae bacterium]